MKKIYLLAIGLLLVGSFNAQAQLIKFGVKGGVNFPSLSSTSNAITFDNKTGWHAGAMLELNIPIVKVGAEFLYSTSTTNVAVVTPSMQGDIETAYFEIPVYATSQRSLHLSAHKVAASERDSDAVYDKAIIDVVNLNRDGSSTVLHYPDRKSTRLNSSH